MKIEFDLTKEDYLKFNMHYMSNSKTVKHSLFIQRYIVSLIFLAVPFILTRFADRPPLIYWMIVFVLAYLLWVIFYPKYFRATVKKRIGKMVDEGKNKGMFGWQSISVMEDGILQVSSHGEVKINWEAVEKIDETEEHIFIYISSVNAYVIPVRAFENDDQKNDFINTLRQFCSVD